MSTEDPYIQVRNLRMAYGDFLVQRDLNFTISRGEVFIIMGGSGCGKSTLMRNMIGLMEPIEGKVFYEGTSFWDADHATREQIIRRCGISYQRGALWTSMTLGENVALPLQQFTSLPDREIEDLVSLKLSLVGLSGFEEYYPAEMSGGMQKRAALARAIALDPDILFFDEPSAGLDPVSARRLDELILELRDSLGATAIVVSHELESIFEIGDNSVFLDMESKTSIATGDPNELREHCEDPRVRAFLTRGEAETSPVAR